MKSTETHATATTIILRLRLRTGMAAEAAGLQSLRVTVQRHRHARSQVALFDSAGIFEGQVKIL